MFLNFEIIFKFYFFYWYDGNFVECLIILICVGIMNCNCYIREIFNFIGVGCVWVYCIYEFV